MKTIGQFLKESRLEKKYTLSKLEQITKIRREFIKHIEEEHWTALPEYPVVLGFVKSIAGFLEIDEHKAVALLRRDYPPQKITINPKPDIPNKEFKWSPRITFFAGFLVVALIIAGYLGLQYSRFIRPPRLEVEQPKEEETITSRVYTVKGITEPDASLNVNNQPVTVKQDGNFESEIDISENTQEIKFTAVSRSGKESTITRKIKTDFK